jgi:hypothetical protein
VEWQLVPISGFHDVIADEIDQLAYFDPRLLEIVDERLSEGTVVSSAIHRNLAGSSGVQESFGNRALAWKAKGDLDRQNGSSIRKNQSDVPAYDRTSRCFS